MDLKSPVLILGAGINGAALARELVLNGVSVVIVDTRDLAAGTTAYSSRLIHGGLRYLEHGDFDLVRESLTERTRWLQLAPHLVRPLRLFIPVDNRFGGFAAAAKTFFGIRTAPRQKQPPKRRGLWTIRAGLWLYDRYARDRSVQRYDVHRLPAASVPAVDTQQYRWMCAYSDAQIRFPERFTLELLLDAQEAAKTTGASFQLFTYHRVMRHADRTEILAVDTDSTSHSLSPAAIVNATGPWVDQTLWALGVPARKMMGGTKGTHFVTFRRDFAELLAGNGIYAEAADGRPVFLLPFGEGVLVGTTDEPFEGNPDDARASPAELQYLRDAVHAVFPQIILTSDDVELYYSGVRPLPAVGPTMPAAITRRHWLKEQPDTTPPLFSIVGGKLTTCRSLAESAARTVLERLGMQAHANSRDRPLSAAHSESGLASDGTCGADQPLAARYSLSTQSIAAVRALFGPRTSSALAISLPIGPTNSGRTPELLDGTPYPVAIARYMVDHEWVRRLDDFIERRLMLLYHRPLTRRCLLQLADVLVEAKLLAPAMRDVAVAATIERLRERFGKRVAEQDQETGRQGE
jgi:glycerol-3-phosphate dehydrogenase